MKFIDVRFCDLPGTMQHFNVPAVAVDEDFFVNGQMFDGSSIRGFQAINESDMKLIPDLSTAYVDPFRVEKTLNVNFSIVDPYTDEPYSRDPRQVARKAEAYLKSTGIADTAFFAPEAEFYVFDDVRFETKQNAGYYYIDSIEGAWNTGRVEEGGNRGYKTRYKGGYFPVPPVDHYADLRDQITLALDDLGLQGRAGAPRGRHGRPGRDQLPVRHAAAAAPTRCRCSSTSSRTSRGRTARRRRSCRSRSSATTARACTATSRCGRTASRCSTTSAGTAACRTSPAGTSAACCTTRRRCWRSRTRR